MCTRTFEYFIARFRLYSMKSSRPRTIQGGQAWWAWPCDMIYPRPPLLLARGWRANYVCAVASSGRRRGSHFSSSRLQILKMSILSRASQECDLYGVEGRGFDPSGYQPGGVVADQWFGTDLELQVKLSIKQMVIRGSEARRTICDVGISLE